MIPQISGMGENGLENYQITLTIHGKLLIATINAKFRSKKEGGFAFSFPRAVLSSEERAEKCVGG
jgi:hypothetical protein